MRVKVNQRSAVSNQRSRLGTPKQNKGTKMTKKTKEKPERSVNLVAQLRFAALSASPLFDFRPATFDWKPEIVCSKRFTQNGWMPRRKNPKSKIEN
jgi:hypothetical protein